MDKDITQRVISALAEYLERPEAELSPAMNLATELELDSLDAVALILTVEDEFGITVEESDLADVETIQDIADAVSRRLA